MQGHEIPAKKVRKKLAAKREGERINKVCVEQIIIREKLTPLAAYTLASVPFIVLFIIFLSLLLIGWIEAVSRADLALQDSQTFEVNLLEELPDPNTL